MTPTSVFPEIDGCLDSLREKGEGGGGFSEGCKLQIWFHSIQSFSRESGKANEDHSHERQVQLHMVHLFCFLLKGVCLSVFTSIGPWSLLQNFVIWRNNYKYKLLSFPLNSVQRPKKVVSSGPGLVDFAIGLVNSVFNLPYWQVMFFEEFE